MSLGGWVGGRLRSALSDSTLQRTEWLKGALRAGGVPPPRSARAPPPPVPSRFLPLPSPPASFPSRPSHFGAGEGAPSRDWGGRGPREAAPRHLGRQGDSPSPPPPLGRVPLPLSGRRGCLLAAGPSPAASRRPGGGALGKAFPGAAPAPALLLARAGESLLPPWSVLAAPAGLPGRRPRGRKRRIAAGQRAGAGAARPSEPGGPGPHSLASQAGWGRTAQRAGRAARPSEPGRQGPRQPPPRPRRRRRASSRLPHGPASRAGRAGQGRTAQRRPTRIRILRQGRPGRRHRAGPRPEPACAGGGGAAAKGDGGGTGSFAARSLLFALCSLLFALCSLHGFHTLPE